MSQPVDILVWKVGSPHEGDTPEKVIPPDLLSEAKELGYRLEMETFPAKGFAQRFFDAVSNGTEPDVLAIDNYGIIEGITTALGNFTGIGSSQKISRSLIRVSESFDSLESGRGGWEFLVSTSRNYKKAKLLVFKQSRCDPEFTGNMNVLDQRTTGEIKAATLSASLAYFTGDSKKLDELSAGEYGDASLAIGSGRSNINDMNICSLWGNERLAFVNSLVSYEGDRSIGQKNILIVLKKPNSAWNLLLLSDYIKIIEELYRQVPELPGRKIGGHEVLALTDPPDQARLARFPRPNIEWSSGGNGVVAYLVDSQFYGGSNWSGSYLKLIPPDSTGKRNIKVVAPFGVGMQPHRWRVWAIYDTGEALISSWRTINYTN